MSSANDSSESLHSDSAVSTEEAQRRLRSTLHTALTQRRNTLIDAPTSIGKSHTVASTPWRDLPEVTGGELVVHLHLTKKARDEAAKVSKETGIEYRVLEGRKDVCPVARGDFDEELSVKGGPASNWFDQKCDIEGIPFSRAHSRLGEELGGLPCSESGRCAAVRQWDDLLRTSKGEPEVDVIHATTKFAHVPRLVEDSNLIFDERPDFTKKLKKHEQAQFTFAINELLHRHSDKRQSFEGLIGAIEAEDTERLREYREVFNSASSTGQLFGQGYVHWSASALGRALTYACPVSNNRCRGHYDGMTAILDEINHLTIHKPPDLSEARCIIGLDGHPAELLWQLNTVDDLTTASILSPEERRTWRLHERGLNVVQIGSNANYVTGGWKNDGVRRKAACIIRELRHHYGEKFRTCITSKALADEVTDILREVGVEQPTVHYYNNLKSTNDFAEESVGLLLGCIDPGDDHVLKMLAVCDLDAEPERTDDDERAFGRGFVGPDSEAAEEFLASVREQNVAQAAGRYARTPGEDGSGAVVYVWTDVLPDHLRDETVPGVTGRATENKQAVVRLLQEQSTVTASEVVDAVGVSKPHAHQILKELLEQGVVTCSEGKGPNPHEWTYVEGLYQAPVDLGL